MLLCALCVLIITVNIVVFLLLYFCPLILHTQQQHGFSHPDDEGHGEPLSVLSRARGPRARCCPQRQAPAQDSSDCAGWERRSAGSSHHHHHGENSVHTRLHTHTPTPLHTQATKNPVGGSYAKALVDLANEKGKLEPIHADMDAVFQLMNSNQALADLVTNPIVDKEKKRAVLQKIGAEAGAFN